MHYTILGNTTTQWASAAAVAAALTLALYFLQALLVRRLGRMAARTGSRLDDIAVETLAVTRSWVLLALGLYAGSTFLTLGARAGLLAERAAICAALVQAAIWGATARCVPGCGNTAAEPRPIRGVRPLPPHWDSWCAAPSGWWSC